ncbi:MAG TPA: aldo/keto reductase [Minicystis sp.]|nr:aldo/keto reductase [Minicystis sp.]
MIKLNNGVEIPQVGLGVFRAAAGEETRRAVRWALEIGYRHVDTARVYGNEQDVGEAIRESGVPREEVFVTTKLWNSDHGKDKAARACEESLKRLGFDYVDLYLIHWPQEGLRRESWKALTKLLESGKCRAIGVSNYTIRHLEEVLSTSDVVPAVDQVELSPFLHQKKLLDFCEKKKIVVEAYSPLVKGKRMQHPTVVKVAQKVGKTPAQVLIRWSMQHGCVVIPKSVKKERIDENFGVFDFALDVDDMRLLDESDENLLTSWDPTYVP